MITYPLNNILYSAEDAELFHCTRTSGVFSADDEFAASVTGADNTVTIGPGIAWIRNARFSGKVAANKTSVSLDMGLADGSYPRIDAVVIQFDANANQTAIVVKQGVAASSPVPPEVVRTEAVYELHLYHVRRAAGAAVVSATDISDMRQDRNYCGVMMDDVTNIDENKFLAKTAYDPSGSVEAAGGIAKYVSTNAPKTNVVNSVTSTSTTDAAAAAAVKRAYDQAVKATKTSIATLDATVERVYGANAIELGSIWVRTYGHIECVSTSIKAEAASDTEAFSFRLIGLPACESVIGAIPARVSPVNTTGRIAGVVSAFPYSDGTIGVIIFPVGGQAWDGNYIYDLDFSYIRSDE